LRLSAFHFAVASWPDDMMKDERTTIFTVPEDCESIDSTQTLPPSTLNSGNFHRVPAYQLDVLLEDAMMPPEQCQSTQPHYQEFHYNPHVEQRPAPQPSPVGTPAVVQSQWLAGHGPITVRAATPMVINGISPLVGAVTTVPPAPVLPMPRMVVPTVQMASHGQGAVVPTRSPMAPWRPTEGVLQQPTPVVHPRVPMLGNSSAFGNQGVCQPTLVNAVSFSAGAAAGTYQAPTYQASIQKPQQVYPAPLAPASPLGRARLMAVPPAVPPGVARPAAGAPRAVSFMAAAPRRSQTFSAQPTMVSGFVNSQTFSSQQPTGFASVQTFSAQQTNGHQLALPRKTMSFSTVTPGFTGAFDRAQSATIGQALDHETRLNAMRLAVR